MKNATQQTKNKNTAAPSELWNDDDIHPYVLVRRDRLDITSEMVERAEHPELENFWLSRLPAGAGSV